MSVLESVDYTVDCVFQPPLSRQVNCVRLQQSRIYTRRSQDTAFVLVTDVSSGVFRTQLMNINPFVNLTVGVTIVNNAWLESDMIQDIYVGSELNLSIIFKQVVQQFHEVHVSPFCPGLLPHCSVRQT